MKLLTIGFNGMWVLDHQNDDLLPIECLKDKLNEINECQIQDSTLTKLVLVFDEDRISAEELESNIKSILSEIYPKDMSDDVVSFELAEFNKNIESSEDDEKDATSDDEFRERMQRIRDKMIAQIMNRDAEIVSNDRNSDAILAEIDQLVAAEGFKQLACELVKIAPEVKEGRRSEIFTNQSYLFSIGEGCGLSTYLRLFAELITSLGIQNIKDIPIVEERLDCYKEGMEPFENVIKALSEDEDDYLKIICIDISEWLNKTDSINFKKFLRKLEKVNNKNLYVFRIPFVEKDVLERIRYSLSDLLYIKAVTFPPLDSKDIKTYAKKQFNDYDLKVDDKAWDIFLDRISEEKKDGKFYGLNTIQKVVKEIAYKKLLSSADSKKQHKSINLKEMQLFCNIEVSALSAEEQLNQLIGNETVKEKISEIIAQIELSLKDNSIESPCIHMRFVGNPGTGKTTVARIIGKMLKEKGVLRVGNFYEFSGRDLCGRYVGETAPKTASICRDAYGSVLFIDEAYSLFRGDDDGRDYGREALETLIAEMENHRNDLVVIMAGYTDEMDKLLKGNAGLASRMPYTIEFPNFNRNQLYGIFVSMVTKRFRCDKFLLEAAKGYFMSLSEETIKSKEFANARFVRNLFERVWAKAALRCELNKVTEVTLTKDDFEAAIKDKEFAFNTSKRIKIGF